MSREPLYGLVVHSTKPPSCTRDITIVLCNYRQPLTLTDLRELTMERWDSQEICSALAKLVDKGDICKLPPLVNPRRGHRYAWIFDREEQANA